MAEQEVIKHTKKVMETMGDREKGWKHKLKEIILEVLIIVFAVSLSISLHNWSEGRHNRHEEHAFLEGLRTDLQSDIKEMKSDSSTYHRVVNATAYFTRVAYGEPLNPDSLYANKFMFFNTTYLSPNISRFEGLKASGKLGIISNKELLNNILDFYQEKVAFINLTNQWFNDYKAQMAPGLDRQLNTGDNENGVGNWEQVLRSNEIRNGLWRASNVQEILVSYGDAIRQAGLIIEEIGKELE